MASYYGTSIVDTPKRGRGRPRKQRIMSLTDVMEYMGIGKNSAYTLFNSGALKTFRVGRNWKTTQEDLDRFLAENDGNILACTCKTKGVNAVMDDKTNPTEQTASPAPIPQEDVAQAEKRVEEMLGFIVTKEDVLQPVILNVANINDGTMYDYGYAYCVPPYYYIYRGTTLSREFELKLPGIYLAPDDHYIWIPVTPGNQDDQWKISDKFATTNMQEIIKAMLDREDISLNIPESGKIFRPEELDTDDILKRAIKRALAAKRVDIEGCRKRFPDKNALFNFKQVVKSPTSRLSMLLFERGCSALNLKYTITVDEIDPDKTVGAKLEKPIQICSEDTFAV